MPGSLGCGDVVLAAIADDLDCLRRARIRRAAAVANEVQDAQHVVVVALGEWEEQVVLLHNVATAEAAEEVPGVHVLERAIDRVAHLVGALFAWLLLAPLFFLFFVPFRALFRRGERDRLMRAIERERASYWVKRAPGPEDPARLERPY